VSSTFAHSTKAGQGQGEAGGIGLLVGVLVGTEPEESGMLVGVGFDAGGERRWLGTEGVFGTVQQQGVLAGVAGIGQEEQAAADSGQEQVASGGRAQMAWVGELRFGRGADGTEQQDGAAGALGQLAESGQDGETLGEGGAGEQEADGVEDHESGTDAGDGGF